MSHVKTYFEEVNRIVAGLDLEEIDRMAAELSALRAREGRLFVLGVGGSAGNAGHAVNDLRYRVLCANRQRFRADRTYQR